MPGSEGLWSVQAGRLRGISARASPASWSKSRSSRSGIGRIMLAPLLSAGSRRDVVRARTDQCALVQIHHVGGLIDPSDNECTQPTVVDGDLLAGGEAGQVDNGYDRVSRERAAQGRPHAIVQRGHRAAGRERYGRLVRLDSE